MKRTAVKKFLKLCMVILFLVTICFSFQFIVSTSSAVKPARSALPRKVELDVRIVERRNQSRMLQISTSPSSRFLSKNPAEPNQMLNMNLSAGLELAKVSMQQNHLKMLYNKVLQVQELTKRVIFDLRPANPGQHNNKTKQNGQNLYDLQNALHNDFEKLVDDAKTADQSKLHHLQSLVTKRITEVQNPPDCKSARKLICLIPNACGLGCLLHHYGVCLFIALGTGRTMFLDFSAANYAQAKNIFQPLSEKCLNVKASTAVEWEGEEGKNPTPDHVPVVKVTIKIAAIRPTLFAAFTIPEGIFDRLLSYHHDPNVWWIGQIMKYLMRVQPSVSQEIEKMKKSISFSHPIVGVHIRRTDKKQEASYHDVEEYMYHVISWYDRYDIKKKTKVVRKVFVATDEPAVIPELKQKYPQLIFLHDPQAERKVKDRRSFIGLLRTVSDVKLLSECDHFVGTYSSNLGRLVYELMQADGERTFDSISVDFSYHYWGGRYHFHEVIEDHDPQDGEIELRVGDRIRIRSEKYALYLGFGENQRTMDNGVYPMHKVKDVLVPAPYPGIL